MIKITEDKLGTLTENIEKGLRYMGKAMQCLDELSNEGGYGHRGGMNYRYPMEDDMGMRGGYGMRDDMDVMGYRRGRYSRM